jgi:tetratricopeptide (TPR) repeat protein
MNTRKSGRINVKALLILVGVVGVAGAGVVGVHYWRKSSMAADALAKGKAALAAKNWDDASRHLKFYLSKYPQDEEMLAEYSAACMNIRPQTPVSVMSAVNGYRRLLLRFRPGNEELCRTLVRLYAQIGDYNELKYICDHWLTGHPGNAEAELWFAKALFAQNDFTKSAAKLSALVERDPASDIEAYRLLGACAMQTDRKGNLDDAIGWMDRCVEAHPQSARARVLRSQLHLLRSAEDTAAAAAGRADLEAAEQLTSDDPHVYLMLADGWIGLAEFERAAKNIDRVQTFDPAKLAAHDVTQDDLALAIHEGRAKIALRSTDADGATAIAEAGLIALTGKPREQFLPSAVRLLLLGGDIARATAVLGEFETVLNRPGNVGTTGEEYVLLKARIAAAEDRPKDVLSLLDSFVARGARDASVYSVAAWAHQSMGNMRDARRLWQKYVQIVPDDAEALLNLARAFEGDNWDEAMRYATAAEGRAPTAQSTLARIEAQVMQAAGRPDEDEILTQCHAELLAVRDADPKASDVRILLASVLLLLDRPADAEAELRKGLSEVTDTAAMRLALGDLLDRTGRTEESIAAYREAIAADPTQAAPWLRLAANHDATKRTEEAEQTLREAQAAVEPEQRGAVDDAMVRHLLRQNRRDEATALLTAMAAREPGDIDVRCRLLSLPEVTADAALTDMLIGEIRAVEEAAAVGSTAPRRWEAVRAMIDFDAGAPADRRAQILETLSKFAAAENVATDWFWSDVVRRLAAVHTELGHLDHAEQALRSAIARNDRASTIVESLLRLLQDQGRFVEAEELIETLPSSTHVADEHKMGVSLARGNHEAVIDDLRQRIAADDQDLPSRLMLASLLFNRNKDKAGALALIDEAMRIDPDDLETARMRVAILTAAGDTKTAEQWLKAEVTRRNDFAIHWLEARFYDQLGRTAEAERSYRKLMEVDKTGAGHGLCGRFLARNNRIDEAVALWREGLTQAPDNVDLHRVLISVLLAEADPGKRLEGRRLLAALREKVETHPSLRRLVPEVLRFEAQDLAAPGASPEAMAEAERRLVQVVRETPRDVFAWRELARLARQQGDAEKAKSIVSQALTSNPNHPDLSVMMASLEMEMGNFAVARSLAQSVRQVHPQNLESRLILLQVFLSNGEVNAAGEVVNEATAIAPGDQGVQMARSSVMLAMARPEEAAENLRSYIDEEGGQGALDAILMLARVQIGLKQYDAAAKRLDRAAELAPADARVALGRLGWHGAQRQFDKVAEMGTSQVVGSPGFAEVVASAAYSLAASGEAVWVRKAGELFQRVAREAPDHPSGHLGWARLAYGEQRVEEAIKSYRRVLEIDAYHIEAMNDLAWILAEHGDADARKEADALASRGLEVQPGNPHLRDTRGVVRWRLGRLVEARADLEEAVRLSTPKSPTRVKALLHLAQVLAAADQPDGAAVRAGDALKLDADVRCLSEAQRQLAEELAAGK